MAGLADATNAAASSTTSGTGTSSNTTSSSPEKAPARNLTQAFEALCMDDEDDDDHHHLVLSSSSLVHKTTTAPSVISPTGVAEIHHHHHDHSETDSTTTPPPSLKPMGLNLHTDLRRELTQSQVNRVSFYGILHDINKEACAMAANDTLSQASQPNPAEEEHSPLVLAAGGITPTPVTTTATNTDNSISSIEKEASDVSFALIDEEEWLLSTIATRKDTSRPCPATFLQAMGEKEYENPVSSLAGGSRTQLWKPSRSWWEAKSGKNPWIEPTSHNKRWRYLWPLIHYHKFLAKCIKKLKRNGVDVKQSVSPVAVFLREEVCAISDHLAVLSLFDSDEWMNCLTHFKGWTDPADEDFLRAAVSKLKLRSLNDVVDVDSPLLRSQIDEHFLMSMASARAQLRETNGGKKSGQPPVYPRSPVPKQIEKRRGWTAPTATNYPPPHPQQLQSQPTVPHPQHPQHPGWWHHPHWDPSQQPPMPPPPQHPQQSTMHYSDNSTVLSGLSADTGSFQPRHPMYPPHPYYYPPNGDNSWVNPNMMYMPPQQPYYPMPSEQQPPLHPLQPNEEEKESSPAKVDDMTQSPFWSHLDRATLATMATPAKPSPPFATPRKDKKVSTNAQPLLLQHQYYGYMYEGYGPPSPATQFMMSPQASYYSYYGVSPRKQDAPASPATVETVGSASHT